VPAPVRQPGRVQHDARPAARVRAPPRALAPARRAPTGRLPACEPACTTQCYSRDPHPETPPAQPRMNFRSASAWSFTAIGGGAARVRTSAAGPAPAGSSAGGAARPSSRSRCRRWSSVQGQRSSTLRAHARSPRHVRLACPSGVPCDLRVPTLASSPSTLEPAVVQVRQLAKPTLQQAVLQLRMTCEISPHAGSVTGHHLHKHPAALPPACWSSGVQRASWRTSSCQAKLHGACGRPGQTGT